MINNTRKMLLAHADRENGIINPKHCQLYMHRELRKMVEDGLFFLDTDGRYKDVCLKQD